MLKSHTPRKREPTSLGNYTGAVEDVPISIHYVHSNRGMYSVLKHHPTRGE